MIVFPFTLTLLTIYTAVDQTRKLKIVLPFDKMNPVFFFIYIGRFIHVDLFFKAVLNNKPELFWVRQECIKMTLFISNLFCNLVYRSMKCTFSRFVKLVLIKRPR